MQNEVKKILDLLAEGKINAEQADKLIDALKYKKKLKKLRISIEEESGKSLLNIKVPLFLAKFGTKFIPKDIEAKANIGNKKIDLSSINWDEIMDAASYEESGELFYMEADDNDKKIIIRILVE